MTISDDIYSDVEDCFEVQVEENSMIDLLLQVGYLFLVLAVISLFICTLPIWLIVLVVFLLMG
jgi:hypothetical protein